MSGPQTCRENSHARTQVITCSTSPFVQGQHDATFPERLFTYNYRLYDRYRRPVASLAVLADDRESWKPTHYGYQLYGREVGIHFPTVQILDYARQIEALLEDPNPFALVTAAHLFTCLFQPDPLFQPQPRSDPLFPPRVPLQEFSGVGWAEERSPTAKTVTPDRWASFLSPTYGLRASPRP